MLPGIHAHLMRSSSMVRQDPTQIMLLLAVANTCTSTVALCNAACLILADACNACKLCNNNCCYLLQVLSITLSSIQTCEDFKGQFMKYDYLWKQDLNQALQERMDCQCC
jgi:hypothetical protein